MRKEALHVVRESRWLSAACVAATLALLPGAARASTKLVNQKQLWTSGATCPVGDRFAPAAVVTDPARIILNGAPSALDRIRLSQDAAAPSVPAASSAAILTTASLGANLGGYVDNRPLEPASRTPLSFGPRPDIAASIDCGTAGAFPKIDRSQGADIPNLGVPAQAYDPDSELGTRAIQVKRTRFDARWDRVRQAPSAGLMQAQLRHAGARAGLDETELLARVNSWVNRRISYVNDDRNYHQADFWAPAEMTIARGSGDCEDFAILKMQMLRAAGVREDQMKLVLLRDLAANADHAFLLVQTKAGKVVLDNTTDRVYDGSAANYVRPVLSFSANKRWVHAYRGVQPAPLVTAQPAAQKSFALAINNYRSVSADPLTFKTGFSR